MRTSYQDHYQSEESSTTPDVLVVETPAPLEVDAKGEGGEEGGAVEGGEEGGAVEGGEGEQEKSVEESEEGACAGKEGDRREVSLESVEKEGDGDGNRAEEGEEGMQDEEEGQPRVRTLHLHTHKDSCPR